MGERPCWKRRPRTRGQKASLQPPPALRRAQSRSEALAPPRTCGPSAIPCPCPARRRPLTPPQVCLLPEAATTLELANSVAGIEPTWVPKPKPPPPPPEMNRLALSEAEVLGQLDLL
jgi:hypothetical protein